MVSHRACVLVLVVAAALPAGCVKRLGPPGSVELHEKRISLRGKAKDCTIVEVDAWLESDGYDKVATARLATAGDTIVSPEERRAAREFACEMGADAVAIGEPTWSREGGTFSIVAALRPQAGVPIGMIAPMVVRHGELRPPAAEPCQPVWTDARGEHDLVATLAFRSDSGERLTALERQYLERRACELGGDRLTLLSMTNEQVFTAARGKVSRGVVMLAVGRARTLAE